MKDIYLNDIAERLGIKVWQVENCVTLLEDGDTIPFISRYRKERTGGLNDAEVAEVKHLADCFEAMEKRKATILETISAQGSLTPDLQKAIESCIVSTELEDLYLPFRPKRRTRAAVAKENGLEPLADKMYNVSVSDPVTEAVKFVSEKVPTAEDALAGARDIIAERISESATEREEIRRIFRSRRLVSSMSRKASSNPEAQKYKSYFEFSMPLSRIPSHNLLAILRGEDEGILNVSVDADSLKCGNKLYYDFCQQRRYPSEPLASQIRMAVDDAFSRLMAPSISNEVIREAKERADIESVNIFGENLRQLLLSPPVGQKRTMAIDPGFRNGCKIACLDAQGELLHHTIIYPHPPQNEKVKSIMSLADMVEKYDIQVIAIGNGTASRETVDFVKKVGLDESVRVYMVSEDGASIYSASEVAREEFPDEDVTVRGAVSIGRRLMDPLAELVKIDPKSLGVGQYQWDVDQTLLKEKLDNTVSMCVNSVGVNLNTASPWLLRYVSGIGPSLASAIVKRRSEKGPYASRDELKSVPRLGEKAFEQCAGFLRIPGGSNPLDDSAVHPESYHIVDRMASDLGVPTRELVGNVALLSGIRAEDYVDERFGLPTINDILQELAKPGRDPRGAAHEFTFSDDIHEIDDLKIGMELPGIVTNITAFGAFVDIGIHENGLIHVSQMGSRGRCEPSKILKLHQHVEVSVVSLDLDRKRIGLRLLSGPGKN